MPETFRPLEPVGKRLVTPGTHHPTLDPMVQTFLDRCAEGALEALPHCNAGTEPLLLVPAGEQSAPYPLMVYLQDNASPSREPFIQWLADQTGFAALLHSFPADAGRATIQQAIVDNLRRLAEQEHERKIDTSSLVLGGDGLGALAAASFASREAQDQRPLLLVLMTPVLDIPSTGFCTEWLPTSQAVAKAERAALIINDEGWPAHYPRRRLQRMPPTVVITAEMDPFRDGAEAFARRLMAAEVEVSASRHLGTIHDFTWLPGLAHAVAALSARRIVEGALRTELPPGN